MHLECTETQDTSINKESGSEQKVHALDLNLEKTLVTWRKDQCGASALKNVSYEARVFSVFLTIQEITLPVENLGGCTVAIITTHEADTRQARTYGPARAQDPTPSAPNSGSRMQISYNKSSRGN